MSFWQSLSERLPCWIIFIAQSVCRLAIIMSLYALLNNQLRTIKLKSAWGNTNMLCLVLGLIIWLSEPALTSLTYSMLHVYDCVWLYIIFVIFTLIFNWKSNQSVASQILCNYIELSVLECLVYTLEYKGFENLLFQ